MESWTAKDWVMFLPALGAFVTGIVAAVASGIATVRSGRAAVVAERVKSDLEAHDTKRELIDKTTNASIKVLTDKVEEVHLATNSLTDRLVEKTGTEAFARGKLEGERPRQ